MSQQIRIRLSDDVVNRLDGYSRATLLSREALIESAICVYLDACLNLRQGLPQFEADRVHNVHTVVQPYVDPDCYAAPKTPHRGAKPTDSDEILALLETANAMPDATETPDDLVMVNAKRKADILAQVGRLRLEIAAKQP